MPVPTFGEHLREQVEERLKYFETGQVPQKNVDVMKKAEVRLHFSPRNSQLCVDCGLCCRWSGKGRDRKGRVSGLRAISKGDTHWLIASTMTGVAKRVL